MGMLIRRHRDRHKTEVDAERAAEGPTRNMLRAEAKRLGLSTSGSKPELAARIADHLADEGKAPDPEADKAPGTEDDPGAGGDNPDAPAPAGDGDEPDPAEADEDESPESE